MKIIDVINAILAYHPRLEREVTCDSFKCGNPDAECTGIVTTCMPSVEVIRQTAELGYNLIICHEPSFYTHMDQTDWLEGKNAVYDEKAKLCQDHGIAIWRDHDHIHTHNPDGIYYGVMKELGWENYAVGDTKRPIYFKLPDTTVRELALDLKKKMQLNAVRVIGNMDGKISTVAFCAHIYTAVPEQEATRIFNDENIDVLIPGELIDWTAAAYARDAGQLGKNKAILHVGHFNWEELGMKYAPVWLAELVDKDLPIQFIRSGDLYQYVI